MKQRLIGVRPLFCVLAEIIKNYLKFYKKSRRGEDRFANYKSRKKGKTENHAFTSVSAFYHTSASFRLHLYLVFSQQNPENQYDVALRERPCGT
jgi:hypothetical protein